MITEDRIKVGIDVPGGDRDRLTGKAHAQRCLEAITDFVLKSPHSLDTQLYLAGDTNSIHQTLERSLAKFMEISDYPDQTGDLVIVHAPTIFPMDGTIKEYRAVETSISALAKMLKQAAPREDANGRILDVIYSGGNSAAAVFYANHYLKPLGIIGEYGKSMKLKKTAPALVTAIPCGIEDVFYLSDVGAMKDPEPVDLMVTAMLTQAYANSMNGQRETSIGLIDSPGAGTAQQYFKNLSGYKGILTPNDGFYGSAKVLVSDGFIGNIMLKTTEAVAKAVADRIKNQKSDLLYFSSTTNKYGTVRGGAVTLLADKTIEEMLEEAKDEPIFVLSNGEEEVKGNAYANKLLNSLKALGKQTYFAEPEDVITGIAHRDNKEIPIKYLATDKYTAKAYQETVNAVEQGLRQMVRMHISGLSGLVNKALYKIFKAGPLMKLKETLDPDSHNGSALLGVNGYAVIGHGAASVKAIKSAINYCVKYRQSNAVHASHSVMQKIQDAYSKAA